MRIDSILSLLFISTILFNNSYGQNVTYRLINEMPGVGDGIIDTIEIGKLNEPLRGVAALYSAFAGTACDSSTCELTTALGLGNQGSSDHKLLINKYFPNDKVAKAVVKQNCYLSREGSSRYSVYSYLIISQLRDTVKVSYKVSYYDHGENSFIKARDLYLFRNNHFNAIRRKSWSWVDKEEL